MMLLWLLTVFFIEMENWWESDERIAHVVSVYTLDAQLLSPGALNDENKIDTLVN